MNNTADTIKSFNQRGGFHIFSSTILLRIIQFILGVLIIRLLSKDEYGNLSYALTITQLILPFSGAGLYLSLLHFGPIQDNLGQKVQLFNFTIRRGIFYSMFVMLLMVGLADLIGLRMPGSVHYLRLFSIYILSYCLFFTAVSFLRILKKNKTYAVSLLLNSILVFLLSLLGVFLSKGIGYTIGFSVAPAISAIAVYLIIVKKEGIAINPLERIRELPVKISDYTKYGVFAGLGNIASQMAWQLDTIMIGLLLAQSSLVATYKVAALIPFSLVFIPSVFMQTDFVYIAENHKNRQYLINYYKKYLLLFSMITATILALWYIFGGMIVKLFGPDYINARPVINILMLNVATTYLFRVPLGNILAAVGKAKWNSYSAIAMLLLNLLLNYLMIPQFEIYGAAYATVISISASCIIAMILFGVYLRGLKKDHGEL